jgi:transposase
VGHFTEVFVGIDVSKMRNAVAIAEGERGGEVRFLGEVDASEESMRRVVKRIAAKYERVHFCYEAGPTGYGLHRLITKLCHPCMVAAPTLIPRKPGDRVKTNRRDAVALARLLRAGELTPVWVPDEGHEAMRDLVRARSGAVETLRVHRQQVSAFMLKHGRVFPRKTAWGARHLRWLQEQSFDHPAHQIALQEMVEVVRISKERVERLETAIEEFMPTWSLAPVVAALQALRGVDLIVATTFVTEIGDIRRFDNPRQLMGYLGLVPSERSTGDTVRRGAITKTGKGRVRHMLVESAWTYRHPPRIGKVKLYRLEAVTPKVREIARKARTRLTARYRALSGRGKKTTMSAPPSLASSSASCGAWPGRRRSPEGEWNRTSRLGGGGTWQGKARQTLCGRLYADARCKIGTAPDAFSGMRYPTRASELDHRRPIDPAPTRARSSQQRRFSKRSISLGLVLDSGHQSAVFRPRFWRDVQSRNRRCGYWVAIDDLADHIGHVGAPVFAAAVGPAKSAFFRLNGCYVRPHWNRSRYRAGLKAFEFLLRYVPF